jgi:Flp pilus assembly protein TadG
MMNHTFSKAKTAILRIPWRHESGQALVEFSLITLLLVSLTFGLIDFYRALYEKEVLTNLSREAANEAARGSGTTTLQIMSNAVLAVANSSEAFTFGPTSTSGKIIVTAVTNFGAGYVVSQQVEDGSLTAAASKIGTTVGGTAKLPTETTPILPAGHTVYVAEIFYAYTPITPIGKLIKATLTNRFYDVAYFSGS